MPFGKLLNLGVKTFKEFQKITGAVSGELKSLGVKTVEEFKELGFSFEKPGIGKPSLIFPGVVGEGQRKVAESLAPETEEEFISETVTGFSPLGTVARVESKIAQKVAPKIKNLLAREVKSITNKINDGGITFDLLTKKALSSGNSVSVYPDRSFITKKKLTTGDLRSYIKNNIDLLLQKGHALGGWFDTTTGEIFLDVSAVIPDLNKAISLGKKFNQKSIFNLDTFEEISTGGTGKATKNLPSIEDRIREILESLR